MHACMHACIMIVLDVIIIIVTVTFTITIVIIRGSCNLCASAGLLGRIVSPRESGWSYGSPCQQDYPLLLFFNFPHFCLLAFIFIIFLFSFFA